MPENPNRPEISRRMEKAEKLLQKGKTPDALAEYLQILEDDPQNDNVRQIAADLCLSVNKGGMAVQLLGDLFERQVAASDATRASLTYKKLARYANPTWEQKVRFGQLLERSNKKLAVGTYENALEDLQRQGRKEEGLLVLRRIVSLEPTPANHLRVAELAADLGEHVMAADSFLQLAEQTETAGGDASHYFERAYTENPADPKIGMAYGKSLLARGDTGAAIFIFEPLVHAENAAVELRDLYAQALLSAERCVDAEPLVWQMFERNPARIHQVVNLIGKMIDCELDAEAVVLAAFAIAWHLPSFPQNEMTLYLLIALSAVAMGIQSAAVRRLALPGIATTVITITITSLVAGLIRRLHLVLASPAQEAGNPAAAEGGRHLGLQAGVFLAYGTAAAVSGFFQDRLPLVVGLSPLVAIMLVLAAAVYSARKTHPAGT